MIHRALFGSIERFFGILIEHYAGAFPAWLAPVQARVLPVRDDHEPYAETVAAALRQAGIRVDVAAADEPLGSRVRKGKAGEAALRPGRRRRRRRGRTVGVNSRGKDRPERGVPARRLHRRPAGRDRQPRPFTRRSVSSLERLWAGWRTRVRRAGHRRGPGDDGCVFCAILASGLPDQETHVVWRHPAGLAAAILNAYPYTIGPPDGHADPPRGRPRGPRPPRRSAAVWDGVSRGRPGPQGGLPARRAQPGRQPGPVGRRRHPGPLHLHVLPRWQGDTNFMTAVADTRVLPEALPVSAAKVRAAWPSA